MNTKSENLTRIVRVAKSTWSWSTVLLVVIGVLIYLNISSAIKSLEYGLTPPELLEYVELPTENLNPMGWGEKANGLSLFFFLADTHRYKIGDFPNGVCQIACRIPSDERLSAGEFSHIHRIGDVSRYIVRFGFVPFGSVDWSAVSLLHQASAQGFQRSIHLVLSIRLAP